MSGPICKKVSIDKEPKIETVDDGWYSYELFTMILDGQLYYKY